MDHRSYGETRDCKGCRFWSEMVAHVDGSVVKAMCLSGDSEYHAKFVSGRNTCDKWKSGYMGAIDQPSADDIVEAYAEVDGDQGDH